MYYLLYLKAISTYIKGLQFNLFLHLHLHYIYVHFYNTIGIHIILL